MASALELRGQSLRAVRACGVRRSRYIGRSKTHLAHVLTAVAINLQRIDAWLTDTPPSKTRHSRFARLIVNTTCSLEFASGINSGENGCQTTTGGTAAGPSSPRLCASDSVFTKLNSRMSPFRIVKTRPNFFYRLASRDTATEISRH
jgi:hypothetical protein